MAEKFFIKPGRLISDEISKAIRQDAGTGMTVRELTAKYAIARSTVHRHIFASPRSRKELTEFQIRDMRKMYKEGATVNALAEKFKLSVDRTRRICTRRNGWQT